MLGGRGLAAYVDDQPCFVRVAAVRGRSPGIAGPAHRITERHYKPSLSHCVVRSPALPPLPKYGLANLIVSQCRVRYRNARVE
ncbi:hypothetical protein GCM10027456_49520 [Kineosporia babensis]